KLPQAHGKERWRQISVEPLRKCERGASRPPDLDLHPWIVKRRKEAESLNVVHVQMGEKDVHPCQRLRERNSESADAGSGVENEQRAIATAHFHARGVAAVPRGFRARRRQRSARSPKTNVHGAAFCQKRTTAPRNRSDWPTSGNAVASMWRRTPSKPWSQRFL